MRLILYIIAAIAALFGVTIVVSGFGVFQQSAGLILVLIGTSTFGFAYLGGKLDRIAKRD